MVYVNDSVITGDDQKGIEELKQYLFKHFQTKDLCQVQYFLEIKVAESKTSVAISQRKYVINIL